MDNLIKVTNNELGTITATLATGEVASLHLTPVPDKAPGIIVLSPGTSEEEHIYYGSKDAESGIVSELVRDISNLNGGDGREHVNGAPWETMITSEYLNRLIDMIKTEHNDDGSHADVSLEESTDFLVEHNQNGTHKINDGWIVADGDWTAIDTNSIAVSADLTGVIQKGDKIKLTNNSAVKYFYVITTPVFGTNTTFDVTGEVDLVAGAITLPFFSKIDSPQGFKKGEIWYKARTKRTSTQTFNDNTVTKVQLNSEDFDPNSNFDSVTNYRYTAPISGHYEIGYQAMIYDTASSLVECSILIYKNGVAAISNKQVNNASAPGLLFTITGVTSLFLNKGDYIELFAWGNTIDNASFVVSIGGNEQSFLDIKFLSV